MGLSYTHVVTQFIILQIASQPAGSIPIHMENITICLLKKVVLVTQYILVVDKIMSWRGYAWQRARILVSIKNFSVYCLVLVGKSVTCRSNNLVHV